MFFCPVGLSLLEQHFQQVLWVLKLLLSPGLGSWQTQGTNNLLLDGRTVENKGKFILIGYVRWSIQTVKFLIVEPSPLPILIPLGPKYSPQDSVFKYGTLSLLCSLNVRDHASQPYSTTGNIIVLYILILEFLERSLDDKNALRYFEVIFFSSFTEFFSFLLFFKNNYIIVVK